MINSVATVVQVRTQLEITGAINRAAAMCTVNAVHAAPQILSNVPNTQAVRGWVFLEVDKSVTGSRNK